MATHSRSDLAEAVEVEPADEGQGYLRVDASEPLARGDISIVLLPQTRKLGETDPPSAAPHKRVDVPAYVSAFRLSDEHRMPNDQVEVFPSPAVIVMDSCEIDRHKNNDRSIEKWDSRIAVAPIIFEPHLDKKYWAYFAATKRCPLYGYFLPPLPSGVIGDATWNQAFVDLRGTTLVSRQHVLWGRRLRLDEKTTAALATRVLQFWYLRETAEHKDLIDKTGRELIEVQAVPEGVDYVSVRMTFAGADPITVVCYQDKEGNITAPPTSEGQPSSN